MGHDAELAQVARFRASLRRFLRATEHATARAGLTPQRYDLLLFVYATPGHRTTTSELTGHLQLGQPAVTELINSAEASGLLRRTRDDLDRRRVWIELTPEGRRRLEACVDDLRRSREELRDSLSD